MNTTTSRHDAAILDQFTRQAIPFAERHASDDELLNLLVEATGVTAGDRVLDLACGPGLVSCAFAEKARHVTGLDLVPAMLERARVWQEKKSLTNLDWRQGTVTALPFAESEFDMVITRFSFHHFIDPATVLAEMTRVCRPGGTVMVCDVAPRPEALEAYDAVEILRDPSHTHALTEPEFEALGVAAGLSPVRRFRYGLVSDLEGLLHSSFPNPGDADKVRERFRRDIAGGQDELGVGAQDRGGAIWFHFPILTMVWRR